MGLTYAEIELINSLDIGMSKMHLMDTDDIRRVNVTMLVDTGAYMVAINENIQEILKLPVIEQDYAETASGEKILCDIVGPVEIRFKTRSTNTRAMVLPGDLEPLLGALALEGMDVIVDPLYQRLDVHPDRIENAVFKFPSLRPVRNKPSKLFEKPRPAWVKVSGRKQQ